MRQHLSQTIEFPARLQKLYFKAIKYEWISLIYMISAAFFSFLVMSNSQTMKTVWLEDMLGIVPPVSFLVASRMIRWKATPNFPYGFHRIVNAAYLTSSLALFLLGLYLFCDGSIVLFKKEHPTIPVIFFGNHSVWLGYLMIIALLWSSVPSTFLGHIKIPLAHKLFDKILFADSKMNKASWMSGFASIFGIIGVGLGFWWADAAVGILISLDIMKDGYSNLKQSVLDLLDEVPKMLGKKETDPLIAEVTSMIKKEKWVKSLNLRFRDEGHIFFGDIFIVPRKEEISTETIQKLHDKIRSYHWRLHDIIIMIAPPSEH